MTIQYNPDSKKWTVKKLATNNKEDRPTVDKVSITKEVTIWQYGAGPRGNFGVYPVTTEKTATVDVNGGYWDIINALNAAGIPNPRPWAAENELRSAQEKARKQNEYNISLNNQAKEINTINKKTNDAYTKVVALASQTKGGDYKNIRDQIRQLDVSDDVKAILENNYKIFYRTEKLKQWDPQLGAKPLYSEFDPKYYKAENKAVADAWAKAVADDDLDIIERYSEESFYLQHYTNQGKAAGLRGNAPQKKEAVEKYIETKPTDADIQAARELQLGVDLKSQSDRLLNIPEVAKEWEKAKNGDPYWKELAKQKYLDIDEPDEFAALFRLSERPEDKQVKINYNANVGYGITELEDAISEAAGERALVDVKKFGALTQSVLKDTIQEMKKARQQEQMMSLLSGFGGFSEITNINKQIADSILNDSGVGGILAFTSSKDPQDSLERGLEKVTGVRSNVAYNWQQWFDKSIKEKYSKDLELGYTVGEAKQKVKVEEKFAKDFVDKYLNPRFNTARSMDEFVEYLDVRQEEKNPFQTQDMVDALKQVAELRATKYLDDVKKINDRYFDPEFYFNPKGGPTKASSYEKQATKVAEDWQKAKQGDPYWAQQAYRFGVDVKDKASFAKLHYQVKGQYENFDGAKDILTADSVADEIYNRILPKLNEEALKQGTVFGQFITPEEFADEMVKGLSPNNKADWEAALKSYGIEGFQGTVDDLKEYIKQTVRTGSAQEIRENIKYLNERRKRPTQETLGITYIERPEDYKSNVKGETELFNVFQRAGYKGNEDEFYQEFFPDVDRSEQLFLTKAGKNQNLQMEKFDFKDPFASIGKIEGFFGQEEEEPSASSNEDEDFSSNYFRIGLDDNDDESFNYKSKTASSILGEFTSMFKGF